MFRCKKREILQVKIVETSGDFPKESIVEEDKINS
jgi:hypothetical protein